MHPPISNSLTGPKPLLSSHLPLLNCFSTQQLHRRPKPSFHSSITPSQMPSNPKIHSQHDRAAARNTQPRFREILLGSKRSLKDLVFCSSWSLELVASLVPSSSGVATSSCCSGKDARVMEIHRDHWSLMASPLFPYHEKSQHWSCRDVAGTPPGTSTPQITSPFSLCQGPLASLPPHPRAVFFTAYLKSANPQELQARAAVRKAPPALAGLFSPGTFLFCCHFVFNPRLSPCSGSLLEPKLEKSSWNSPGEQKGFCAGGFGGPGCFHCCCLRACFPCAKVHLGMPKSTWLCQRAPGHGRAGGGMGRRCQSRAWALPGHRGCVGRSTDTSHTCQQCKSSTELPKYPCTVAHPNLCAWLCSFLAP